MLIELALLGGALGLWKSKQPAPKKTQQTEQKNSGSLSVRALKPRTLLRDIRHALRAEGREQLQLDIDPQRQKLLEAQEHERKKRMKLSLGAMGLALLGSVSPRFMLLGAAAVLYLSRESFKLIYKDFKRGHYLSVYLIGLIMTLGMILTGNLALAAFTGVIGGFFAGIINRIEQDSQQQLIRVFSGHPEQVWLLRDGVEIQIEFHQLQVGDIVVVNAGEVIPVDGRIQTGEGRVDQHVLTGESEAVEKSVGEEVYASTLLLSGRLAVEVLQAGNDTMAAKIGDVLNQTQNYKDTLTLRGRKVADRFLPVTVGIGAVTLPLLGPEASIAVLWSNLGGIMAPAGSLTVLSYLQILSRHQILVKDGRVFESLKQVDTIIFDKTGTLTLEQPTLGNIHVLNGFSETEILRYAAAAEYRQPHPIAKAIVEAAQTQQVDIPLLDEADYEMGYGIKVTVEARTVCVGSARFMQREGIIAPPELQQIQQDAETEAHSLVYVAIDDHLAGVLEMQPTLRPEITDVIHYLKQRNITLYIISGDHEAPTRKMAQTLGIEHYFAEVLPEHKADYVNQLKEQGRFVCFIGDGINDAIALKSAQVSISLKGASTAATDTAQIIFMDGTLNHLSSLFQFVDEFEQTMDRNYVISMVPGGVIIGGVYLLHFGIALSMGIFYLGCFAGLGNVLWPLVKHQEQNVLEHTESIDLDAETTGTDKPLAITHVVDGEAA